jgi:hypothetical protein
MWNLKNTNIFVNEVETQLRENTLRVSQTQEIHYDKTKLAQRQ